MNTFAYKYPVTVYFGEKSAANNLPAELAKVGKNIMLAYGGGSIKKNGIYDELVSILKSAGKNIKAIRSPCSSSLGNKPIWQI